MYLDAERFKTVVACTPLVSIDLLIRKPSGVVLLGQRLNRPAQGYWFVPGGRICKNESLDVAFQRISQAELGQAFERRQARLLGTYEHFYPDSVFGAPESAPDTHYVVLGYLLEVDENCSLRLPQEQHDTYRWWEPADIYASAVVHDNTRAYLVSAG